jgi:hypothetical protein
MGMVKGLRGDGFEDEALMKDDGDVLDYAKWFCLRKFFFEF